MIIGLLLEWCVAFAPKHSHFIACMNLDTFESS